MNPVRSLLGVFAVLGTWPKWESYFDLSRKGLKSSFVILALSLIPLWMVIYGIQFERAAASGQEIVLPGLVPFILIAGVWLFSFPAMAYLISMVFEKMDRVRPWMITRNWTVFAFSILVGVIFAMVAIGLLPFVLGNGVLFAAYFGLLAADIRLAQKVAGFNFGTAILLGCVIVAVGMIFVMLAMSR